MQSGKGCMEGGVMGATEGRTEHLWRVNSSRETMISSEISENLSVARLSCELRNYLKKLGGLVGHINHVIFIKPYYYWMRDGLQVSK